MKLATVVVTYEPNFSQLAELLNALSTQVGIILVIDNNSSKDVQSFVQKTTRNQSIFISLKDNYGIAYAQNRGIQEARDLGYSYFLLMDQDSVPALDMVQKLMSVLLASEQNQGGSPVAAVGPAYIDMRTDEKSFFTIENNGLPSRWSCRSNDSCNAIGVSFLMASGTLIPLSVFQEIGGKRSNYFIDHVDTEWCFRARAKGYRLLGVPNAELHHALGDEVKKIWFFGYRHVAYHSPLRHYYMFRNTLLLLRDVKISLVWKLHLMWRLMQFAGYFLLFTSQRRQRFYCMSLGFCHGFFGVSGRLNMETSQCMPIPVSELDPII